MNLIKQAELERDEINLSDMNWCKRTIDALRTENENLLAAGKFTSFQADKYLKQLTTEQNKVKVLVDAANLVVDTHDKILPIMNAYMGTLGTTSEWEKTCIASDALREALATVKGE